MQNDEVLGTKLWLEENHHLLEGATTKIAPTLHKFSLEKSDQQQLHAFLVKQKISLLDLQCAAWGLLLNKISTAESVMFSSVHAAMKGKRPMLSPHHQIIHSKLSESVSIKQYLNGIKKQTSKNSKENDNADIRYLFLTGRDTVTKSQQLIDIDRFRLSLFISPKDKFRFTLIYHPGYFTEKNITFLAEYYRNILVNICQDASQDVVDIEVMSADQKKLILTHWAKPKYPFKTPIATKCAHELVAQNAIDSPDKIAIAYENSIISFAQLDKKADELADLLIEAGVKRQENVAVLMDRTPSLVVAMLAIFKIGAVFVPINSKYPNERIEYVIEDSQSTCLLVNNPSRISLAKPIKTLTLSQDWQELPAPVEQHIKPAALISNRAYIIYTSGTTGKPKGVVINHSSLANLVEWYRGCFKIIPDDRQSQFASQGFDTYMCETMPILALGASIHIVNDHIKLSPNLFFNWLASEKITLCDLPTAYALMLFSMDWPDNLCLRMMKIGGETCTRYPAKNYQFDIWNCYGPTESTIEATFYKMHEAGSAPNLHQQSKSPSIGKIIANGEAYVVDQFFKPVPPGVAGELLIGGVCLSPGYYNRDELTNKKFINNIFSSEPYSKLYRTGDLVCWMPDGNLQFIGRIDNQVKIRGYRIELGAIEDVISKYPDVREVAVIAKEAPNGEKTITAYVVPKLDRERFLYQERCLISIADSQFIESITEDISKNGIALSGVSEKLNIGAKVKLHLKLPGFNTSKDITARVIWQIDNRCGLVFDLNKKEQETISKSIDYFLSSHNIMDMVLSSSTKRSLRKALKKKLPEYMVPSAFVTLLEFPLTFSGKVDLKALPPPNEYEQMLRKQFVEAKTETEKRLTEIWKQLLGVPQISMEDNFFDLGGNSIKAAELSVRIMMEFNISMPANILFDLSYVPILAEYIDTRGSYYSTQSIIQEDIERDKILHENIAPVGKLSNKISNPDSVLLTGAGGFLGVFMLNELLVSTNAKIYCLVRKGEFESAARRLDETIRKFNLSDNISLSNRRIIAVPADLSLDKFGIPLDQYNSMAEKVDLVYHCGAQVNIMASYNHLRGSNVQGTHEIIKFATLLQDKPIHYISTLSAAYLKDDNGALVEEFPTEQYSDLFGGYAISKWVSERLLTELKDRGLPVTIYRSGYISGHSTSGITSLNDSLLMLIKGCIAMGYAPEMREKVTILPVDFVSRATVKLSLLALDKSAVYHIDHPTGILWCDLVSWLNNYGYSIKITSMAEWKRMLHKIRQDNALYPFLPYYLALPDDYHAPEVRTEKATDALKKAGITYPEINNELLNLYFDYLCSCGFLFAPAKEKTTA